MTTDRTASRLVAFALASLVTLAVLAGLDTLAHDSQADALMVRAAATQPA